MNHSASTDATARHGDVASAPRGRILRLKEGYNPNSSSMGSIVFALPVVMLGASVLFGAAAGLIASAFLRGRRAASPPGQGHDDDQKTGASGL
jgi:hypothetical protein